MLQLSLREMAKYKAREDITDLENDSIIALKDISDEFSKLMRNFDKKKDAYQQLKKTPSALTKHQNSCFSMYLQYLPQSMRQMRLI